VLDAIIKVGKKPESLTMENLISIDTDFNVILENDAIECSNDDQIALLAQAIDAIQNRITMLRYDYLFANGLVDF
jgi:hypothetical protein